MRPCGREAPLICYASITGTRRNIERLLAAGWRWFIAPGSHSWEPMGMRYALDNGAWSTYQSGKPWDAAPFEALVAKRGAEADFIVAPDIVAGGLDSLALSESWLPRLPGLRLIAVQDGMEPGHVAPLVGLTVGIFLGGSTVWKLAMMAEWGRFCRERSLYLHIGRVNTARRIRLAHDAGAASVDGTSATRYAVNIAHLDLAARQEQIWKGAR